MTDKSNIAELLTKHNTTFTKDSNLNHIGYTDDSNVFEYNGIDKKKYVVKCIMKDSHEKTILDLIYKNDYKNLSKAVFNITTDINIDYNIYIFDCFDCDLYHLDLIELKNKYYNYWNYLGMDLIDAVKNVHLLGYTHGDLKPLNVCLDKCKIKLIDFGISKPISAVCNQYHLKNTFYWFSPVQFINMIKSDFWSIKEVQDEIINLYNDDIKEVELILNNYSQFISISNNQTYMRECPVKNDWFVCGLLLIYIYTPEKNFWLKDLEYEYTSLSLYKSFPTILDSMKKFLLNPTEFLENYLLTYGNNIPNIYKTYIKSYILNIFK